LQRFKLPLIKYNGVFTILLIKFVDKIKKIIGKMKIELNVYICEWTNQEKLQMEFYIMIIPFVIIVIMVKNYEFIFCGKV
jgi:hypothetical protein